MVAEIRFQAAPQTKEPQSKDSSPSAAPSVLLSGTNDEGGKSKPSGSALLCAANGSNFPMPGPHQRSMKAYEILSTMPPIKPNDVHPNMKPPKGTVTESLSRIL